MKKQLRLLMIFTVFLTVNSFGQFKIINTGSVGIGTNSPAAKLQVEGDAVIFSGGANSIRFLTNNPGTEIGSSYGNFNFFHSTTGYNDLFAHNYITISDSSLKSNITPLTNCTAIIKKLNGFKYQFKQPTTLAEKGKQGNKQRYDYGVLAQEVERVLPDLVFETKGNKAVNYTGLIPVMIEAMKEQQKIIEAGKQKLDSLSNVIAQCCSQNQQKQLNNNSMIYKKIDSLSNIINQCCSQNPPKQSNNSLAYQENATNTQARLYQNVPNPFSNETSIAYEFGSVQVQSASIAVFDMQGALKKTYQLELNKKGTLIIKQGDLNPGMYIYSLIINQHEIDSKKMILLE